VSRLRGLGFGLAIVVLTVAVIAGVVTGIRHIPRPEKKIEWVHSNASIIVQMKVNGFQGVESSGIDPYVIAPEFTLYGDGTLIASKTGSKCPCRLIRAKLSGDEVRDLLQYIEETGFFNFSYIEPGRPESAPITYIYAAVKEAQNISGRHVLVGTCIADCTPPLHYRKLGDIQERLEQVIEKTIADGNAIDHYADTIVLTARVTNVITGRSTPPQWPIPQVDLATIANGSDFGSRRMEGDLARQVQEVLADYRGEMDYLVNGQWYAAGYTPILPHADNFPEFEPPQ
jgi:hypothetical protein